MKKRFLTVIVLFASLSLCGCNSSTDTSVTVKWEKDNYQQECDTIKNKEYTNISFDDCVFEQFPDITEFTELTPEESTITPQMAVDELTKEITRLKLSDEYPPDKTIRVIGDKIVYDNEDNPEEQNYALAVDCMDSATGNGFYIAEDKICCIMGKYGFGRLVDGRLGYYLEKNKNLSMDAEASLSYLEDEYPITRTYKYEDIDDTENTMLDDSKLSIKDAADMAVKYIEAGNPYPVADGVSAIATEVQVLECDGRCAYEVYIARQYNNIPFSAAKFGNFRTEAGSAYSINEDIIRVYIADSLGVCAYDGDNASEPLIEAEKHNSSMISLENAADIASEAMGPELKLNFTRVGLRYIKLISTAEENDNGTCKACWMFRGTNNSNTEYASVYVDAVTGEVYFRFTDWS